MAAAVQDKPTPLPVLASPGRFTRVMIETRAGEIEARLSEYGNWELRVRRHEDDTWRLACSGDLDCGAVTKTPVIQKVEETLTRGPLVIDPISRRGTWAPFRSSGRSDASVNAAPARG